MDISKFTDPAIIGPGIWFEMHTEAVQCKNDQRKRAFVTRINNLCDKFRCIKCKLHFKKFINSHPFENYWFVYNNKGEDIGFYKWTWECHNNVNRFLGKPQVDLEESYEYYMSQSAGVCIDCGKDNQRLSQSDVIRMSDKDNNNSDVLNKNTSVLINTDYKRIITPIDTNSHVKSKNNNFKISTR